MARIIDARVRQKAATLEEWNNSDLDSLDGEQLFVRSEVDDKVIGFKFGSKNKKFSELDYPDFTVRGKVSPTSTWVGRQSGVYIPTSNGTYNTVEVNLAEGYQVLYWDGTTIEKVVYPSDYSGAVFGGAIDDTKDLSTPPTEPTWYIASPGDYNTTPAITLTENSILSWDGNEWSHIPFELEVRGEFLVADNIAEVRNITPEVAQLLVGGTYKGVEVLGYYEKGDTPAPIIYYISDTESEDDGGSVIEVGDIKLEHEFVGNVNPAYFGYNENILDISPILENIYAKYINIEFDDDIQINLSYFNFYKDNTKILFNNSIIVYNGEVVEGIDRVVDVSGNKIKFYDFNVSTDIEISRGVVITGDDFYSNYTYVKGSFFYGFEIYGDNIRIDIFKGEEGRYSQLRLINSKNINSVSFGRIFLTGGLVKGFLVNGKGEVDSIYIGEYFNEMEDGLVDGSNGFLVDPDLPTDTKNIKSLYINRFENRGSESGAFKCQNISSLYINEYYDYRKGRAYGSSYAFRADFVDNLVVNKMYIEDRILMNNSSGYFGSIVCMDDLLKVRLNAFMWVTSSPTRCKVGFIKCLDTEEIDTTRYIFRFEGTNPNSYLEIEDIERTGDRGIIGFYSGQSNTHPNTISLGKKASAIRGGLWASFYGGVVQRTPTVYMTGTIPSSGNYKIGDIIYLTTPDKFIGRVCTSVSPLTFNPFGEIGIDLDKPKSGTTANRPTVTTVGFKYFNTTINQLEVWNGSSWQSVVPNATPTIKGLVNQGVAVPDGSSIDTLLASLRAAGIIAT